LYAFGFRYGVSAEPDLRIKFNISSEGDADKDCPASGMTSVHVHTPKEDRPVVEFVILACDGLWERYSEASAVSFVRNRLVAGTSWCAGIEHRSVRFHAKNNSKKHIFSFNHVTLIKRHSH
jgi:serine/threonine protein phosphatase PrpC